MVRRPFPSVYNRDDLDFNEVFFNDVRVPATIWSARSMAGGRSPTARSAMNAP